MLTIRPAMLADEEPVLALFEELSIRFGLRCWLEDLVVTAARRGEGIGRRLLDAATDWARARGCTHLELNSAPARKDAHRFYLASGMAQSALNFSREIE